MALSWTGHESQVVSHRSVLRSFLFMIYINDIDVVLNSFNAKFAHDAKIVNSMITDYEK